MNLIIGIVLFLGAYAFLHREMTRMFAEEKARSRSPFKEKLLRPPGEGLRLQIGEIREEIMEKGMVLAVLLVVPSFLVLLLQGSTMKINLLIWSVVSVICYGAAYCQWKKIKALREKLRNHRLGFDGERYVAEKLAELSAQGYRVFHDFVFDMKPGGDATNFNIDHIVVGTNGVFALETKTWRQPNGVLAEGSESHKVTASADQLHLPGGHRVRKPAAQALRNARDLAKWLTGSSPHPVPVYPIVVMPGWYVTDDKTGVVPVLSGKPVAKMLPREGIRGALTDSEVRALADRIEAHCRNVEGG
jgi:hypothetical protein